MSKKVFDDFFASASLYDEIDFPSFLKFFPAKYHKSEILQNLYHWYRDDRIGRRKVAKQSSDTILGPLPSQEVTEAGPETIEQLQEQEEALRQELESLEDQVAEKKNTLQQFNSRLDQVVHIFNETPKSPMPNTADLDKLLELLDEINADSDADE